MEEIMIDVLERLKKAGGGDDKLLLEMAVKMLRDNFQRYSWVGIYLVNGQWLELAAFAGDRETEHVKIKVGAGICGLAAKEERTVMVDDVSAEEQYIACFPETRSEIVVPIFQEGKVVGEIDIDGNELGAFNERDKHFLEELAYLLGKGLGKLDSGTNGRME